MVASSLVPSSAVAAEAVSAQVPVLDAARILSVDKRDALSQQLLDFEKETGWRLRVLTSYGGDGRPSDDDVRSAWRPDKNSVVVIFDPSNPNLTNVVYIGDNVLAKLRRPWWFELQSRYGNLFYVREEGEQKAVLSTMSALTTCLGAPEGCKVVPGLPDDQASFTLALSIAGGLVAGSVTLLEPTGWIKSRWAWLLVFSPLWASLYVNFGLGPVFSRTDDLTQVWINTAGFLAAAVAPYAAKALLGERPPPSTSDDSTR